MKVNQLLRILWSVALILSVGPAVSAQSTQFTYQGELSDSSQTANGAYDFEFLLFDATEGGTQLGDAVLRPAVQVADGRFSVMLDFGTHFTGANRFLEIRVTQSAQPGQYATLTPRQPVMTVPYAMKSLTSDVAATATDADSLGGVSSNQYVLTTDSRMTDPRPPTAGSSDYVQNTSILQPSSNFNISGMGRAGAFSADRFDAITEYEIGGNRVLGAFGQNTITGIEAGSALENGALNSFFGYRAGFLTTDGSENSIFGAYAGSTNTTGVSNSFFGHVAGNSNTGGSLNSFFGSRSGQNNTLGGANSFFGNLSGYSNAEGSRNAFFGSEAGYSNVGGSDNSFFGTQAGQGNIGGAGNSFFGHKSGFSNTGGSFNSFFGRYSGAANTTGIENSFFGSYAGIGNTIGASNTFVGFKAGFSNTEATGNSFFGAGAGENTGIVASGNSNTFIGRNAGNSNTVGSGNTLVGAFAFIANQEGQDNTAVGTSAGANGAGNANAFFGNLSGYNTTGNFNTFIGSYSGASSEGGDYNSSLGAGAGPAQPALQYSTAIGAEARVSSSNTIQLGRANGSDTVLVPGNLTLTGTLNSELPSDSPNYIQNRGDTQPSSTFNISGLGRAYVFDAGVQFNIGGERILSVPGTDNTFLGVDSGSRTAGTANSFFGQAAGEYNTIGQQNSFFGSESGLENLDGERNAFFGYRAGFMNRSGYGNTFIGRSTGSTNIGGFHNTLLGLEADVISDGLSYATAIGAGAIVSASNMIQIGRPDGSDNVVVSGDLGVGIDPPSNPLAVSAAGTPTGGVSSYSEVVGRFRRTTSGHTAISVDSIPGQDAILYFAEGGTATWGIRFDSSTSDLQIRYHESGANSTHLTITANGYVTIPSLGPAGSITLCRNASNQISACSSSIRYKSNLKSYFSGTEILNRLRPVTFNWKDSGAQDIGLVAEEVAEIEPLLVTYSSDGLVEGVKYDRIGVVLVNVIKEQQEQLDRQDSELEQLRKRVSELEKIKSLVCKMNQESEICR